MFYFSLYPKKIPNGIHIEINNNKALHYLKVKIGHRAIIWLLNCVLLVYKCFNYQCAATSLLHSIT